jgi:hypothetical protein
MYACQANKRLFCEIRQDTKSIKDLPPGVDSLKEEEKQGVLKSLVGQLLYLDLTRPDLMFLISDLARSSSKTSDERLRVARSLLRKVREPAKSIVTHASHLLTAILCGCKL